MFQISDKLPYICLVFSTISMLTTCSSINPESASSQSIAHSIRFTADSLFIDPSALPESLLAPATVAYERKAIQNEFEKLLLENKITSANFVSFNPVLFSYRDPKVIPLFREIVQDTSVHIYFRMLAVYCLGNCGSDEDFTFLCRYSHDPNPLYREYIASALNKLASTPEHFLHLRNLVQKERNPFVYKTLMAKRTPSINTTPLQLPLFENEPLKKELFFPNDSPVDLRTIGYHEALSAPEVPPVAESCICPHQQYKVNRCLYELIDYPVVSFGFENDEWGIHVGEDSGWLFPGMPIHAIMDGVVVRMQHESTWGCLTVIESRLSEKSYITVFYGHLSHIGNVAVGDTVLTGDKIGEIGSSYTLTNGGYLAHLHLGIEKTSFNNALVRGWFHSTDRWHSPMAFIANFAKKPPKESPVDWILFKSRH